MSPRACTYICIYVYVNVPRVPPPRYAPHPLPSVSLFRWFPISGRWARTAALSKQMLPRACTYMCICICICTESATPPPLGIAIQVVSDFGTMGAHSGTFKTDVAESVLVGFYVACRLGWVTRQPPIRRYSNGGVVLPKPTPKSQNGAKEALLR